MGGVWGWGCGQFSNLCLELTNISEYHWASDKQIQSNTLSFNFTEILKKEKEIVTIWLKKFFVFISVLRALNLSLTDL